MVLEVVCLRMVGGIFEGLLQSHWLGMQNLDKLAMLGQETVTRNRMVKMGNWRIWYELWDINKSPCHLADGSKVMSYGFDGCRGTTVLV